MFAQESRCPGDLGHSYQAIYIREQSVRLEIQVNELTLCRTQLASKSRTLENEDWEIIKPQVEEHMNGYKEWLEAHPLTRHQASVMAVERTYNTCGLNRQWYLHIFFAPLERCDTVMSGRRVMSLTNDMDLDIGHYLSLPKIKAILMEQPEDMAESERTHWVRDRMSDLGSDLETDLVALCHTIKKDLVRKVLLKEGKSVAQLDSWDNAKLQEVLDKPDIWFRCISCKYDPHPEVSPGRMIPGHACTANQKGEKRYGDRAKYFPDSACIPVGWQSDSVELADGFKGLHSFLEGLARAKHNENTPSALAEATFRFPSSHSAIALDHRWKFKCGGGFCYTSSYTSNRLKDYVSRIDDP